MQAADQTERFPAMLQAHKGILYKLANSYCPDAENRKDLVQDMVEDYSQIEEERE